jgi:hypothetical protein
VIRGDFRWGETLEGLDGFGVEFILIGGLAANLHGSPSVTMDIDICHERSMPNLEKLAECLRFLEARLRGVDEDVPFLVEAESLRAGDSFTFSTVNGSLDCLGTPAGTDGYADLERNAVPMHLDSLEIGVASLDDLMRMKRAAGRPKDRVELEILGALRQEIAGGS